ncbi:hypothetical protein OXPF_07440 [Oxobacter pfennigii]|uniref:Uncharacterized protein n=1 Tax=Oxobacter pfennigii TaxID=36849 RepID=A0A0P8WSE3_9CLOT|nr:hypothetical protein OXPF_07440 [Oxobacter pfennigii]
MEKITRAVLYKFNNGGNNMHMADALISAAVGGAMRAASTGVADTQSEKYRMRWMRKKYP